jgi:DNA-directed RNA polymerase specialized sigma24 family protein
MLKTEDNQDAILRACQEAVDLLSPERGWYLIEPTEWADRTYAHVLESTVADPLRAAVHVYSRALYAACSGRQGQQRREQGYEELFRFVHAHARKRYPLVYDDAAQQALVFVVERFAQCREPGAFLAFALLQLLAAARNVGQRLERDRRGVGRLTLDYRAVAETTHDRQADLSAPIITAELRASFERLEAEFLRKHPRAHLQFAALRLKFIGGLDEATISQRLGKPISSIYVLRARAIEKLRAEPEWRALAAEFGILPE